MIENKQLNIGATAIFTQLLNVSNTFELNPRLVAFLMVTQAAQYRSRIAIM